MCVYASSVKIGERNPRWLSAFSAKTCTMRIVRTMTPRKMRRTGSADAASFTVDRSYDKK